MSIGTYGHLTDLKILTNQSKLVACLIQPIIKPHIKPI